MLSAMSSRIVHQAPISLTDLDDHVDLDQRHHDEGHAPAATTGNAPHAWLNAPRAARFRSTDARARAHLVAAVRRVPSG